MLLTLFSQVTPSIDITFSGIVSLISLCVVLILAFRKESREDGQTTSQRLKKLEAKTADHDQLHTGQVQAREQLAQVLQGEMKRMEAEVDRRCTAMERDTAKVEQMRLDMASMQEQLKRLPGMEVKLDDLHTLLTKFLASK